MKINVKRIPEIGETLRGAESAAILDLEDPNVRFEKEIEYELHAQVQGNALLVTGTLRTPATALCGRCLKKHKLPLVVQDFVFHHELQGEDFVDLTDNFREDILLQLPQRTLCSPNCKGLCPVCGQDLNVRRCSCEQARKFSGRWSKLDELKLE
jgi:uncharacterized protein